MGEQTKKGRSKAMKTLEAAIEEVKIDLARIDREGQAAADDFAAVDSRTEEARKAIPQIESALAEARAGRQVAFASGGDVTEFTARIRGLQEKLEEQKEGIEGLLVSLEELRKLRAQLTAEYVQAKRQIPILKLRDAAMRYNALAEQLAPIVAEIHDLRAELEEPPKGLVVQSPAGFVGALAEIPRLFLPGTDEMLEIGDPGKQVICFPSRAAMEAMKKRNST
jgi:chromosome segregation ATPase